MDGVLALWLGFTLLVGVFSGSGIAMCVSEYNSNHANYKKREAKNGLKWCLFVFLTCWAWPAWAVWCIGLGIGSVLKVLRDER